MCRLPKIIHPMESFLIGLICNSMGGLGRAEFGITAWSSTNSSRRSHANRPSGPTTSNSATTTSSTSPHHDGSSMEEEEHSKLHTQVYSSVSRSFCCCCCCWFSCVTVLIHHQTNRRAWKWIFFLLLLFLVFVCRYFVRDRCTACAEGLTRWERIKTIYESFWAQSKEERSFPPPKN